LEPISDCTARLATPPANPPMLVNQAGRCLPQVTVMLTRNLLGRLLKWKSKVAAVDYIQALPHGISKAIFDRS
jgi:hypothetical protein